MRRAIKTAAWTVGILLLVLIGCVAADQIPMAKARPPKTVQDINSCLAWLNHPMGAYKITDGDAVYYRITGPAGRFLASGPSAYTFDSRGKFIGWTADLGEFPTPGLRLSESAKREKISLEELRRGLQ
jgi:hypothetical protein